MRLVKAVRLLGSILSLLLLLLLSPVHAQSPTGRILGTVVDQTGASMTNAKVVITDVQRGSTRTLATDESGGFVAPNLLPGIYKVRAEARGFKSVERTDIQLEVAKDVRIDLTLQPGQVSETVVVSGEVPLVDATSSTLGGTLSNDVINDLPLNGRRYADLALLEPGVQKFYGAADRTIYRAYRHSQCCNYRARRSWQDHPC